MIQSTLFEQATLPKISGVTFSEAFDRERLTGQMRRVYDIMLKGEWLTLNEIARKSFITFHSNDSQTGISARLRDLRKPSHGSHSVESRRRGDASSGEWEYRLVK